MVTAPASCNEHFKPQHLTIDHTIQKLKGDTDHIDNLQLLYGHCNDVKGGRDMGRLISRLAA